jgi:hypothetical protein
MCRMQQSLKTSRGCLRSAAWWQTDFASTSRSRSTLWPQPGINGACRLRWNEAGHRTKTGQPWSHTSVLTLLRNPVYIGQVYSAATCTPLPMSTW